MTEQEKKELEAFNEWCNEYFFKIPLDVKEAVTCAWMARARIELIQKPIDTDSLQDQIAQAEADKEAYPEFWWKLWQWANHNESKWFSITDDHSFSPDYEYRQHPHRENIIKFNACSEEDKKRWQYTENGCSIWHDNGDGEPSWVESSKYRIRPRACFIMLQDGTKMEFPEPVREALSENQVYYFAGTNNVTDSFWIGNLWDTGRLNAGLIHLTEEAAKQHLSAMQAMNAQVAL